MIPRGMVWLMMFLLGAPSEARDLVVVDEGAARAVIVTPAEPTAVETLAAQELVTHLEDMSGVTLPVMREGSEGLRGLPRRRTRIFVGQTEAARGLAFPSGGFAVRARRRSLVLVGDDDPGPDGVFRLGDSYDQAGTLSAVYALLQDELGVRWLWPGPHGTHTPKRDTVVVPRRDRHEAPGLTHRRMENIYAPHWRRRYVEQFSWADPDALAEHAREHALWMRRMRLAGHLPWRAGGHAYAGWFDRFRATRLDYFALQADGVRGPLTHRATVKICASNPGVWDQVVADWEAAKGRSRTLSVAENDGDYGYCTCAACRALDVEGTTWQDSDGVVQPAHTDRYVHLANAVAGQLAERDPGWSVRLYAYNALQDPPRRETLAENVAIDVVEGTYPATEASRTRFRAHWRDWRAAVPGRLGWRPNVHHTGYGLPVAYADDLGSDLDFLMSEGVDSLDFDAMTASIATAGPAYYLAARRGWDADRSSASILAEYYEAFGPAGPHVQAADDVWRSVAARLVSEEGRSLRLAQGPGLHRNTRYALARLTEEEDYARAARHLDAAAASAATPEVVERVRHLREGLGHAYRLAQTLLAFQGTDRAWIAADTHLPIARALRDERLALDGAGVVPGTYLSWSERVGGDLTGLGMLEDVEGTKPLSRPPVLWYARLDPDEAGVAEGWHDIAPRDAAWQRVRADRAIQQSGVGRVWERTHDWTPYRGAAWYRAEWILPEGVGERTRALYFPEIAGEVVIWIDGHRVAESAPGAALRVELPKGLPPVAVVTLRVRSATEDAGLLRPPWLLSE